MKSTFFLAMLTALTAACCTPKSPNPAQFVGHWIEIMPANPQITQGVTLSADGTAQSIGMATLLYERWVVDSDSTIILTGKSVGNGQTIDFSDTMTVVTVTPDSLTLGKFGRYRVNYYRVNSVDSIRPFNVLDSLPIGSELGELQERTFEGLTPAASNPGIRWTLDIYNQIYSGDGVYKLQMNYLEADNGKDQITTTYGRLYTLRGDATNKDATVYQLIAFGGGGITNFLRLDGALVLLNDKFERTTPNADYTLKLKTTQYTLLKSGLVITRISDNYTNNKCKKETH